MKRTTTAEALMLVLLNSLSPETLAAAMVDLQRNDQITEAIQDLADWAEGRFSAQLTAMVGDDEAHAMVDAL